MNETLCLQLSSGNISASNCDETLFPLCSIPKQENWEKKCKNQMNFCIENLSNDCKDFCSFRCKDDHKCISKSSVCDGISDCSDNSDELFCGKKMNDIIYYFSNNFV